MKPLRSLPRTSQLDAHCLSPGEAVGARLVWKNSTLPSTEEAPGCLPQNPAADCLLRLADDPEEKSREAGSCAARWLTLRGSGTVADRLSPPFGPASDEMHVSAAWCGTSALSVNQGPPLPPKPALGAVIAGPALASAPSADGLEVIAHGAAGMGWFARIRLSGSTAALMRRRRL